MMLSPVVVMMSYPSNWLLGTGISKTKSNPRAMLSSMSAYYIKALQRGHFVTILVQRRHLK